MTLRTSSTNSSINFGSWNVPTNTSSFTIMGYFVPVGLNLLMSMFGRASSSTAANTTFSLRTNRQEVFAARLRIGTTTTELITGKRFFTSQTRYHLAMTYDGSVINFYVDGAFMSSANRTGSIANDAGQSVSFGSVPGSPTSEPYDGFGEDLRIYLRAFTVKELQHVLNSNGNDGLYDDLYFWSKMNEGYANQAVPTTAGYVTDSSGSKFDGTKTGVNAMTYATTQLNFTKRRI